MLKKSSQTFFSKAKKYDNYEIMLELHAENMDLKAK
jgi:hypothetical protein